MSETDLAHSVSLTENPPSGRYRELLQWPVLGDWRSFFVYLCLVGLSGLGYFLALAIADKPQIPCNESDECMLRSRLRRADGARAIPSHFCA